MTTNGAPIRVVVVDDHPMFREGLASLLESSDGHVVVGQAGTGAEAIDVVDGTDVDVVLMDLHMPVMNGIEATRRIMAAHPGVAVLALTMVNDDVSVIAAMQAGARGYLLKEATLDEIVRAIAGVAVGDAVFGAGFADRALS